MNSSCGAMYDDASALRGISPHLNTNLVISSIVHAPLPLTSKAGEIPRHDYGMPLRATAYVFYLWPQ